MLPTGRSQAQNSLGGRREVDSYEKSSIHYPIQAGPKGRKERGVMNQGIVTSQGRVWHTVTGVLNMHKMDNSIIERPICKKIDRSTIWGNPYKIGEDGTRIEVVARYEHFLRGMVLNPDTKITITDIAKLSGRILLCWCMPELCHGNVLAKYADYINHVRLRDGIDLDMMGGFSPLPDNSIYMGDKVLLALPLQFQV